MSLYVSGQTQLTEFRRSDERALLEYLADGEIYKTTARIPHPYTAADAQRWFDVVEATAQKQGRDTQWAVRQADGKLIGAIGLAGWSESHPRRAEIGYWLAKPFWGQGIATAAVRAVCRHAFDDLHLTKITAHIFAGNAASCRVVEKCGFQQEGYLHAHYLKDGTFIDAKVFGLLNRGELNHGKSPRGDA